MHHVRHRFAHFGITQTASDKFVADIALHGIDDKNGKRIGDETAASLGLNVEFSRTMLMLSAVLLASCAVSLAGLLGFVGLVIPHAVRLIGNSGNSRRLMLRSASAGAVLVMLCDAVGRSVAAPAEIPAGVVTALIGAPFFLYILMKKGRAL